MLCKTTPIFLLFFNFSIFCYGQNIDDMKLPYKQIPEYPENYTSGNVISRLIDGLGYRYYWATEGLTEKDLKYIPSEEARSTLKTLEHIYDLSKAIVNASQNKPNIRSANKTELLFNELREKTLLNFKKASDLFLGKSADDLLNYAIVFQNKEQKREFPYWNMINGQISDAIYHVGQIVSFRRSSGNPMNSKVNVFIGKTGS